MNIGQQILFLLSALGALNGILLSLYIFFRKKQRTLPVIFLSLMLMAISLRIGNSVFRYFNAALPDLVMQIGWSACFLIGPSVYYFFVSTLEKPGKGLSNTARVIWSLLAAIILIGGMMQPYAANPDLWCQAICYFIHVQWAAFLVAAGFLLKMVIAQLFFGKEPLNTSGKFWLLLYGGNCIIFLSYQTSMTGIFSGLCLASAFAFSLILFITVFYYLHRVPMEDLLRPVAETSGPKPAKRRMAEPEANALTEKLWKVLAEKELYKDPNLKLGDLAQKINISGHQLSQLLNDHLGKNFSTYLNEYRIEQACRLIREDSRLSFEAIGYEVGYNSKSTFYAAFRKIKDTTPALYRERTERPASSS